MPQELHVVRCYNCQTFQVDIVKKIPKWVCKMCGERQSLNKVYGKGTGKECRQFVQDLNVQRLTLENPPMAVVSYKSSCTERNDFDYDSVSPKGTKLDVANSLNTSSKWDEFVSGTNEEAHSERSNPIENGRSGSDRFNAKSENIIGPTNTAVTLENIAISSIYDNKFGLESDLDVDLEF